MPKDVGSLFGALGSGGTRWRAQLPPRAGGLVHSESHLVTANADFDGYRDLVAWATDEAKNEDQPPGRR